MGASAGLEPAAYANSATLLWWRREESNLHADVAVLQTAGLSQFAHLLRGAPGRSPTLDPLVRSQPLCALSYGGMVADLGFEPRTSGLSDQRLVPIGLIGYGTGGAILTLTVAALNGTPPAKLGYSGMWHCPGESNAHLTASRAVALSVELGQYGGERRSRTPACYRPLVFETSCRPSQQRSPIRAG